MEFLKFLSSEGKGRRGGFRTPRKAVGKEALNVEKAYLHGGTDLISLFPLLSSGDLIATTGMETTGISDDTVFQLFEIGLYGK